jgi:hypothetical protein
VLSVSSKHPDLHGIRANNDRPVGMSANIECPVSGEIPTTSHSSTTRQCASRRHPRRHRNARNPRAGIRRCNPPTHEVQRREWAKHDPLIAHKDRSRRTKRKFRERRSQEIKLRLPTPAPHLLTYLSRSRLQRGVRERYNHTAARDHARNVDVRIVDLLAGLELNTVEEDPIE